MPPLPPPSCMQSRCHPRQGGQRLPHKDSDRVLGAKTHMHCTLHAVSFSVLLLFAFSFYMQMHFIRVCPIYFNTPNTRPVGRGRKRAGSVCLSLVFQQEAPGLARHLRGAATADKEEAINPQKITRTDTLSHRNTTTQPDSFHLQYHQRKNEGERGWAHLVNSKTHRKPACLFNSGDLNFLSDGAGVGLSVCVWACIWFGDVLNSE